MEFRTLRADEIDCRVGTVTKDSCTILLYKDARADMNLLDETVGAANWQRKHQVINGNLFCQVGIKINGEWVWKEDVGTESNTEAEKGQASDSFKRACVNWGIGRELYTSPEIWINGIQTKPKGNDKYTTYEKFEVTKIEYDEKRNVVGLEIINKKTGAIVYTFGYKKSRSTKKAEAPKMPDPVKDADMKAKLMAYINNIGMSAENIEKICKHYGVESIAKLQPQHCEHYIAQLKKKGIEI